MRVRHCSCRTGRSPSKTRSAPGSPDFQAGRRRSAYGISSITPPGYRAPTPCGSECRGPAKPDWTSDGVIAALSTMPDLEHDPGAAYAYSNVGYVCLARILERLSGQSLDHLARAASLRAPADARHDPLVGPAGITAPRNSRSSRYGRPHRSRSATAGSGRRFATSCAGTTLCSPTRSGSRRCCTRRGPSTTGLRSTTPGVYGCSEHEGDRVESHGGSWEGATAKLVRLPDRNASFAVLALDDSVERMTALSSALQRATHGHGDTTSA